MEDYKPEEIIIMNIAQIKIHAEEAMKTQLDEAVFVIPQSTDEMQLDLIRNASRLVNLEIITFIDKATATVIHYKLDNKLG